MRLDTFLQYNRTQLKEISNSTVIVVDVLRATTSIICALMNGANKVIPTADAGSAAAIAQRLGHAESVLAGERGGIKLPGFDIGNSPAEFSRSRLEGKNVVINTTNGTGAIVAAQSARHVLIGGMINRAAVARRALDYGDDIVILCAGTDGLDSADDLCAAGAIASAISHLAEGAAEPSDMTLISCLIYSDWMAGRADLSATRHWSHLVSLGFGRDVEFCFTQDITDVVPVYANGAIAL